MSSRWKNQSSKPTLCWDCKKSTCGGCPWSANFTPVKGWVATETTLSRKHGSTTSFLVRSCPLFERDAVDGGMEKKHEAKLTYVKESLRGGDGDGIADNDERCADGARNRMAESARPVHVDGSSRPLAHSRSGEAWVIEPDYLPLAYGILERAVLDWQLLDYGARAEAYVDSQFINRKEVVRFFFGEWFLHLCDVTDFSPEQFRKLIRMPEDALEIVESGDAKRRFGV